MADAQRHMPNWIAALRLTAGRRKRQAHFKVYDLSDEAQRIIRDGVQRKLTLKGIQTEVAERTGEHITTSSLHRFASEHRAYLRLHEMLGILADAAFRYAESKGYEVSERVQAQLLEVVSEAAQEGKLKEMGPYAAGRLALAFAEADRKNLELALRAEAAHHKAQVAEGNLALAQQKLDLLIEKARQARPRKDASDDRPPLSLADAMRELFGLPDDHVEQQIHKLPSGDEGTAASDNSAAANAWNTTGAVPADEKDFNEAENQ